MRVIERYATAAIADDLKDRGPLCDLHILTAAGMAGVSDSWATSLLRLKNSNDPAEFAPCLSELKNAARRISAKNNWKITPVQIHQLARKTLQFWIADICPTCLGRGAAHIAGTPILEDIPCDQCGGTGRRKLPQSGNMREYAFVLLYMLDEAERMAGGKMMQKIFADIAQNGL